MQCSFIKLLLSCKNRLTRTKHSTTVHQWCPKHECGCQFKFYRRCLHWEDEEREREKGQCFSGICWTFCYTRFVQEGIAAYFITCLPCRNSTNPITLKDVSDRPMLKYLARHWVTLESCRWQFYHSFLLHSPCKSCIIQYVLLLVLFE